MMERRFVTIKRARSATDLESTAQLFAAYAKSRGSDISSQDFDAEIKSLPGKYAPPTGEILLALDGNGRAVGCVAIRPLPSDCCELKRLYVLPPARGLGTGRKLLDAILDTAASLGYKKIKLGTLPSMSHAMSLYGYADFVPTTPYYETPLTGVVFLARQLEKSSTPAESD